MDGSEQPLTPEVLAARAAHIDRLHHKAYCNPDVSVHVRLQARDALRQIKEGTYAWPTLLR